MKITNSKDYQLNTKINLLVYGHGGVGKTTFASTAPNPIFADCEGGTNFLGKRGISVDVARITSWKDMEDFYREISKSNYDTIVIDPANEALEKLISDLKTNPQFSNRTEGLTLQGWGVAKDRMRLFLKALRDLDKHIIIIAHVDEKQDDKQTLKKRPKLQANLSQELVNMMDVVAYMQIVKNSDGVVKRVLRVQPDSDDFEAKDRSNTLGEIVEPDFTKIVEAVVENKQFSWTKQINQKIDSQVENFNKDLEDEENPLMDPDLKPGWTPPADNTIKESDIPNAIPAEESQAKKFMRKGFKDITGKEAI